MTILAMTASRLAFDRLAFDLGVATNEPKFWFLKSHSSFEIEGLCRAEKPIVDAALARMTPLAVNE
jgi:hypothetical protein